MSVNDLLKAGGIRWKVRVLWAMFMVRFAAFIARREASALRALRRAPGGRSPRHSDRWDGVRRYWLEDVQ